MNFQEIQLGQGREHLRGNKVSRNFIAEYAKCMENYWSQKSGRPILTEQSHKIASKRRSVISKGHVHF